jgi:hypothetical protein
VVVGSVQEPAVVAVDRGEGACCFCFRVQKWRGKSELSGLENNRQTKKSKGKETRV